MASRVELFAVTVPLGTAIASPQVTALDFDIAEVDAVSFLVPKGCNGLVGFQLRHSNAGVFPREDTKWIIANGETIDWPVEHAPTGRKWQLRAYNTGIFDHTIYVRLLVREVDLGHGGPMPALTIIQPDQVAPVASDAGYPQGVTL